MTNKRKKYGSKIKKYIVATNKKGQTFRYAKLANGSIVTVSRIVKKKKKGIPHRQKIANAGARTRRTSTRRPRTRRSRSYSKRIRRY